jgi:8-oxo-dGTP diphosphatase
VAQTKKPYCYAYPRPAVTVDIVVVTRENKPRVLLIRRKHEPFAGKWALPGGFVDEHESLEAAARRELLEETGVFVSRLQQLQAFGDPGRDPRGHTVSIVYLARIAARSAHAKADDDAAEVGWHRLADLPPLAFDHRRIVRLALKRMRQ